MSAERRPAPDRLVAAPTNATVRMMPACRPLLADRRGTVAPRRPPACRDRVIRPITFKTMGRPLKARESDETGHIVTDKAAMVPTLREGGALTDRLVAALVIMVQQASHNRPDGAGTLPSSSELRTA
jgi:hypothetical protein